MIISAFLDTLVIIVIIFMNHRINMEKVIWFIYFYYKGYFCFFSYEWSSNIELSFL